MKKFIESLGYALHGVKSFTCEESNARIQFALFLFATGCGFFFQISTLEWALLLVCSSLVLTTEALNTSVENLCDFVSEGRNPSIKKVKDLAAGATLIASTGALICGLIIFLPKILELL